MLKVQSVESAYIHQTWLLVESMIKEALVSDSPALYNSDHVLQYVASGQWLMLVAVDDSNVIKGVATISFANYPLHRVAFITAIAGKLFTNAETYKQLCTVLKSHGATLLQGYGRPAIVRLWKRYNIHSNLALLEYPL